MRSRTIFILLSVFLFASFAFAQNVDPALLKSLEFRSIGPAVMGGRIPDVAIVEKQPHIMYVGGASGGVFKTTNNGTTWQAVFDDAGTASVGDIAVAPSNPEIVWVGTGEPNNRQSSSFGDGIYKSTDGGKTWKHMGLRDTQHIGRILIDPVNPEIVYVAALGHLWGPNRERGVFKTTDGGATWTNILFVNEDTGAVDMAMDPSNSQVIFAATYQRRRTAWGFNGGGPGGGLHKTVDGGRTWRKLGGGLPTGIIGRIGLDLYRKDPRVVYATVEHRQGGIYRSDDGGDTWQRMTTQNPRPMYYSKIRLDPNNDKRVYVLGSSILVSNDGARTFADPGTARPGANTSMTPSYDLGVHGDHHFLWIDPANSNHLVLGNDGGLYFSYDGSVTWDKVNNIPLGQYYAVSVDMRKPYYIYGGLQDTHSWGGPSATRHHIGIMNSDWFQTNFGDGMTAQADPTDPNTVYVSSQNGAIVRFNSTTGDRKDVRPRPKPGDGNYRFYWTAPFQISPHDPKTLYLGGNRLFKSADRGESWTASGDLTKQEDRDKFPIMGVQPSADMLSRGDGVSDWGTITALAESPVTRGVLWVGTDDGNLQISRDGGTTFSNVVDRIAGLPKNSPISRVEPSYKDAGTAYVSFDRHQYDDFTPYVYMTTDYGQTWKAISSNLPEVGWVNVVREHPKNPNLLVAGSETGLLASFNKGGNWVRLKGNFPTVPVDDLVFHPRDNDLVVATHGRSLFVLDDAAALSGLTPEVLASDTHLFDVRPATISQTWKDESYSAQRAFAGPNPPRGAIINYYLKSAAGSDVKVSILDAQGRPVREITGTKGAGINRVVWDLRTDGPSGVTGARGPFVLPGSYTVKISASGREMARTVQVEADPAMPLSDTERRARFTFLITANQALATIQSVSGTVTTIVNDASALVEQLTKLPNVDAAVKTAANDFATKIRNLQRRILGAPGGFGGGEGGSGFGGGGSLRGAASGLFGEIDGNPVQQGTLTGPTANQTERLQRLQSDLDGAITQLNALITTDIPRLNETLNRANIPRIAPVPPVK